MKLYIVKGEHPTVPGTPSKATFDKAEADRHAADMLTTIYKDVLIDAAEDDDGVPVDFPAFTAENWRDDLLSVQATRHAYVEGMAYDEARHDLESLSSDDVGSEIGLDVWIEEHDVVVPAPAASFPTKPIDNAMGALSNLIEQVEQMKGMFPDEDGTIQDAIDDAEEAILGLRELSDGKPVTADIAVILDGGLVQHVTMRGGTMPRVFVVDYDTEGADNDDVCGVPQDDGEIVEAYVSEQGVDRKACAEFWDALIGQKPFDCGQCEGSGTIEGGLGGDGDDEECPVCDGMGMIGVEGEYHASRFIAAEALQQGGE